MTSVRSRLLQWAKAADVACTDGYCDEVSDNLNLLNPETREEFKKADGNEFRGGTHPPKIAALHSSSALAVNVFDYWRNREDKSALEAALGCTRIKGLCFERKFATGVGPRSPNIDVVLDLNDGGMLAIESKFSEWTGHSGRKSLKDAYLPPERHLWTARGFAGAQNAAETYMNEPGFDRLDVPQLLKHMLGLATQRPGSDWRLLLLWHRCDETLAPTLEEKIQRFRALLGTDACRFESLTYQELWGRLSPRLSAEHGGYKAYLGARYFD